MMQIAVVGSRHWERLDDVERLIALIHADYPHGTIVSGGASGVDLAAENAAIRLGMSVVSFRPYAIREFSWGIMEYHFGPSTLMRKMEEYPTFADRASALFFRNLLIVQAAQRLVAFWDLVSRGTCSTIDWARDKIPVRIYSPKAMLP